MSLFLNAEIKIDSLPIFQTVLFNPLQKSYLTVKRISISIWMSILLGVIFLSYQFVNKLNEPLFLWIGLTVWFLILILAFISASISFRYSGYAIREKDILYRSGWIFTKISIIPLNRIQHVSLHSGPIERKFGLASIKLFSAGGDDHDDFSIKGIPQETADQIREWLAQQINIDSEKNYDSLIISNES